MVDLTKHMKKGLAEQKPGQILAFAAYINKISDIVKFTIGEPDFNTPEHIKKAAEASIANSHSHYAPSNGTPGLRKAAADFLAEKYGQKYDPSEILITNGVTESIYDFLTAVLNPGDAVLMPTPIFPLYIGDALSMGATVEQIDTSDDGFKLTPAKLQAALDQLAKIHQAITTTEPTPMQDAAEEALGNGMNDAEPMKKEFQKRRDVLYEGLTKLGFECVKPKGAFYIFAKIPAGLEQDDTKFIYDLAEKGHVAVIAGSFFAKGGAGYIRLSYATSMDQIKEGLKRLEKYVAENKQ